MGFTESEEALHQEAMDAAGCDDFGDPSYREGLRVLLAAYDSEARLNAQGQAIARHTLVDLLTRRLRAEQAWKDAPEVLQVEIKRPLIICGLVRTGSTALHYLMGQDPGLQPLQYWLANHPQPRPPRASWEDSRDYQASVAELDAIYGADPSLKAVHFMMPDGPEECRHLLSQHFTDDGFEVNASVPSYSSWYAQTDMRPTYRRHKKLIQLIGSTDTERRWLLKYPVHVRHLDALLDVYPDACVIWTHRDPARVLPSYCSLMAGFRAFYEDDCDPKDMTDQQMELWAAGLEKAIAVRARHDAAQFYDLHFHDFMADPIDSIKSIYTRFGQELSEEGLRCLRAWRDDNPQHKFGKHEYSDDIGAGRTEIWDRFATYMDHFGMRREG